MDTSAKRREVVALYREGDYQGIRTTLDADWDELASQCGQDVAEIARNGMIACLASEEWAEAELWRVRALRRAVDASAWGVLALLVISNSLKIAAIRPDADGYRMASAALQEMVPLIERCQDDPDLTQDYLHGLYREKRGYLAFAQGLFDAARQDYHQALALASSDERRQLKIRGALALCRYLEDPEGHGRHEAITETSEVLRSSERRFVVVEQTAEHNLAEMRTGGLDVRPYEVL